jgi:hypothetical protein
MKLWVLCDLNLEFAELLCQLLTRDADVCVVAGVVIPGCGNGSIWPSCVRM